MHLPLLAAGLLAASCAFAQTNFDVATVKPSSGAVEFERDGEVTVSHGSLRMHDVTLLTSIKWAYQVQRVQIDGPEDLGHQHYDIIAKVEGEPTTEQMRVMLRSLLAERFALKLHPGTKQVDAYCLTIAPKGLKKLKVAAVKDGEPWHQNSSMGMVARNFSMQDFVTYMSEPLAAPLVDKTNLSGKYDFDIDFRPYVDEASDIHADPKAVMRAAFEGELGLRLVRERSTVATLVIDHVDTPMPN
ncbi:TIGR03435 family protein [Terriglobus roseus]|uniref:Soil-associated protein, TIGR03435 family n=1 Tax=Terriglobus roseus TaxID=392734 RepID=A0A1H4TE95_9BACT|nr:TIGR03435 family protein [Terriglobus roseus]SEC54677.1 soil-associated protein, TIGR03435 family [Terriglobus roseus]